MFLNTATKIHSHNGIKHRRCSDSAVSFPQQPKDSLAKHNRIPPFAIFSLLINTRSVWLLSNINLLPASSMLPSKRNVTMHHQKYWDWKKIDNQQNVHIILGLLEVKLTSSSSSFSSSSSLCSHQYRFPKHRGPGSQRQLRPPGSDPGSQVDQRKHPGLQRRPKASDHFWLWRWCIVRQPAHPLTLLRRYVRSLAGTWEPLHANKKKKKVFYYITWT